MEYGNFYLILFTSYTHSTSTHIRTAIKTKSERWNRCEQYVFGRNSCLNKLRYHCISGVLHATAVYSRSHRIHNWICFDGRHFSSNRPSFSSFPLDNYVDTYTCLCRRRRRRCHRRCRRRIEYIVCAWGVVRLCSSTHVTIVTWNNICSLLLLLLLLPLLLPLSLHSHKWMKEEEEEERKK